MSQRAQLLFPDWTAGAKSHGPQAFRNLPQMRDAALIEIVTLLAFKRCVPQGALR